MKQFIIRINGSGPIQAEADTFDIKDGVLQLMTNNEVIMAFKTWDAIMTNA